MNQYRPLLTVAFDYASFPEFTTHCNYITYVTCIERAISFTERVD